MKTPSPDFINLHANGRCDAFAVALHRVTGWSIKALWSDDCEMDPESGEPILVLLHAWCRREDGVCVDARGVVEESTLIELYGDGVEDEDSVEVYKSERAFLDDLAHDYSGPISNARETIEQHLAFYTK